MTDSPNRAEPLLPTIPFGPHRVSRLIIGSNPINGGSHLSRFVNQQMRRYFTAERIVEFLRQCEQAGINTWQSGPANLRDYERHRSQRGQLQYISLACDDDSSPGQLARVLGVQPIGVAHHGEVTDRLFKDGQIDQVQDFLLRVRDAGTMVGVSTHMPAVVDHVESHGWDVDFYMTCVYERQRTREELRDLLGCVPIPIREVYLEEDPPRMFQAMRQTTKPCLAFKILAAGRLCDRQETTEAAFKSTFAQIKANDAVIVGMWPEFEDQVALNAGYVRRFGT